jgi:alanyl-tRNA synthetase
MLTKRIYYTDPYLTELKTEIKSQREDELGIWYSFQDTIFYPEGGGQGADKGWINTSVVHDVQSDKNTVWHLMESPLSTPAIMKLDWDNRYGNMQQHTGQHILSACFKDLFDLNTVSVHLGREITLIELETEIISDEILGEVEKAANDIIRQNLVIKPVWVKKEKLPGFNLRRSIKTTDKNIRLVNIGDLDCVGCGGLHVQSTSEVGLIKIVGTEKIRKHVRIKIKVGESAYSYFYDLHQTFYNLSSQLTTSVHDLPAKIDQLLLENRDLGRRINKFTDLWLAEYAKNLPESDPYGCYFLENYSMEQLKSLSESWSKIHQKACLFVSHNKGKYNFFMRLEEGSNRNIQDFVKKYREEYSLKGGGRKEIAMGEIDNNSINTARLEKLFTTFNKYFS